MWAAGPFAGHPVIDAVLARAKEDEHPLVRETADAAVGPRRAAAGAAGLPSHLSTIETMHLLHAVPIFSGLDPEDLHELALYAIDDTIEPPSVLFTEGDADCDALFVILAGRVSVERVGFDGGERSARARWWESCRFSTAAGATRPSGPSAARCASCAFPALDSAAGCCVEVASPSGSSARWPAGFAA